MRQNGEMTKIIGILLKLGVIAALIIAAATNQEYSYYIFLRWLVVTSFTYFAYNSFKQENTGIMIFFGATALLFNPFWKFWFQSKTWQIIDYIIVMILIAIIVYEWTLLVKFESKEK